MLDFKLDFPDEDAADFGPGRYSDKKALAILKRYLCGDVSVKEAAAIIVSMLPNTGDRSGRRSEIGRLDSFLVVTARQIPYQHAAQTKMVQLVQRLSVSPKLCGQPEETILVDSSEMVSPPRWYHVFRGGSNGNPAQRQSQTYPFYSAMESFFWELRDWSHPCFTDDDEEGDEQYPLFVNFTAFLARLTQCGFIDGAEFLVGLIRHVFESKLVMKEVCADPIEGADSFNALVAAAALYFILAGQAVYTFVVLGTGIPEQKNGVFSIGDLYSGPEFGLQRWAFWKEQLKTVAAMKNAGVTDETVRLARNAAGVMDSIELAMQF